MTLADLTSRDAVLQALAEYNDLERDTYLATYGFGKARSYYLQHAGRLYDSKAVVGAAHGYQIGQPLTAADFSGGEAIRAEGALLAGAPTPPWGGSGG